MDINSSEISAAEHRAHVAAIQAAALVAAGLVVEGTEIEVWGVRFSTGRVYETNTERSAVELSAFCGEVVHRTRTTYPDCVTEWVAVDEGGE